MGFNFAGIITKSKITNEQGIENLTGEKVKYLGDVGFDEATTSFKESKYIDLLTGKSGSLLITSMECLYDIADREDATVQFIISDVSDTYYFEMVSKGETVRKLVISEDEVHENTGEGLVDEESDMTDIIWDLIDEYLENEENISDSTFKRFEIE